MQLYQEEEIGLFTFYKQQQELEDKINQITTTTEQSKFILHDIKKPITVLLQKSQKNSSQTAFNPSCTVLTNNLDNLNNLIAKGESSKNKMKRSINRLKFPNNKSQTIQQNSQKLKQYLQRLLTDQQGLCRNQVQKKIEEKRHTIPRQKQQIDNVHKISIISKINYNSEQGYATKQNQIFGNISHLPTLAKFDSFPKIQKKSYSQNLKNTNLLRKRKTNLLAFPRRFNNASKEQSYLQQLKTDRNHCKNTYTMNIECINPLERQQRGQKRLSNRNLSNKLKNKLMLQLAKTIKFQ